MNDSINITYTPATGDLLFTTARQTSGLDEAIKAIGDFIRSRKDMGNYIGVDYDNRIAADHAPCDLWEVDTNVPKGFHWSFEEPKQLTIKFE